MYNTVIQLNIHALAVLIPDLPTPTLLSALSVGGEPGGHHQGLDCALMVSQDGEGAPREEVFTREPPPQQLTLLSPSGHSARPSKAGQGLLWASSVVEAQGPAAASSGGQSRACTRMSWAEAVGA